MPSEEFILEPGISTTVFALPADPPADPSPDERDKPDEEEPEPAKPQPQPQPQPQQA